MANEVLADVNEYSPVIWLNFKLLADAKVEEGGLYGTVVKFGVGTVGGEVPILLELSVLLGEPIWLESALSLLITVVIVWVFVEATTALVVVISIAWPEASLPALEIS
jgi:hypothetical protein